MELNVRRLFRPRHVAAYVQIVCGGRPYMPVHHPLAKRSTRLEKILDFNGSYLIIASASEHMREELYR